MGPKKKKKKKKKNTSTENHLFFFFFSHCNTCIRLVMAGDIVPICAGCQKKEGAIQELLLPLQLHSSREKSWWLPCSSLLRRIDQLAVHDLVNATGRLDNGNNILLTLIDLFDDLLGNSLICLLLLLGVACGDRV